jgi:hypothetical protein
VLPGYSTFFWGAFHSENIDKVFKNNVSSVTTIQYKP